MSTSPALPATRRDSRCDRRSDGFRRGSGDALATAASWALDMDEGAGVEVLEYVRIFRTHTTWCCANDAGAGRNLS